MKKNKTLLIVLPIAIVLVAAIVVGAVLLIVNNNKQEKYLEQMKSASQYLQSGDYNSLIDTYKAAIQLQPDKPEPYIGLAQAYIAQGNYVEAEAVAQTGYDLTKDSRLTSLLSEIQDYRINGTADLTPAVTPESPAATGQIVTGTDAEGIALRGATLTLLSDYCYQEYVNTYGDASVVPAGDDGYGATFKGLSATLYFKNTASNRDIINEQTRTPAINVRPYKIAILSPSVLFINFDGYISYEKLCQILNTNAAPAEDPDRGGFFVRIPRSGYELVIETDMAGNVYKPDPVIEIYLNDLVKVGYVNDAETFVLGSHTYTYDVTSIEIDGEDLDLTPLSKCQQLQELILTNCVFNDLSPVADCSRLTTLVISGSRGFRNLSALGRMGYLSVLYIRGCTQLDDLSVIPNVPLTLLDVTGSGVSYENAYAYKESHQNCSVWYDDKEVLLQTEQTVDPNNLPEGYFILGSQTFSYQDTLIQLNGDTITDMEPLRNCKQLAQLILTNCSFNTLEPLTGATSLTDLYFNGSSGFTDLTPLGQMSQLRSIYLHGCSQITDITPLDGLNLDVLDLCYTGLSYEVAYAYKERHPDCLVWYDNKEVVLGE